MRARARARGILQYSTIGHFDELATGDYLDFTKIS